jgi:hypothetical protein
MGGIIVKVYLAEYEIYEDKYGELYRPYTDSAVFLDFDVACRCAKEEIDDWLESCGIAAEDKKDFVCGHYKITERDTEDEDLTVEWCFDWDGELRARWVWDGCAYNILPGDERPEAGMKFRKGDFVQADGELYIVVSAPREDGLYCAGVHRRKERYDAARKLKWWENEYCLGYLNEQGYYCHTHIHEAHLAPYSGEAPQGYQMLREILSGQTKISLRRLKEVCGADLWEDEYVKREIDSKQLSDDSTDTASLLMILLNRGKLALPGKPAYRQIGGEK